MRMLHLPELTDQARARLMPAGPAPEWAKIRHAIETRRAHLFACPDDSYLVLQVQGDCLVILAAAGVDGVDMFRAVVEIARANNLRAVRWHTRRRGLARLLSEFGPVEVERICEVTL